MSYIVRNIYRCQFSSTFLCVGICFPNDSYSSSYYIVSFNNSLINQPSINQRQTVTPEALGVKCDMKTREVKMYQNKLNSIAHRSQLSFFKRLCFRDYEQVYIQWSMPHGIRGGEERGIVGTAQEHIWTAALSYTMHITRRLIIIIFS